MSPLPTQKIIWRRKMKFIESKSIKFHKIRVFHSPSYVIPKNVIILVISIITFLGVPTRIVEQVKFSMQWQWYEFLDSPGTEIDFLYIICQENHNKCYSFTDTIELKSAALSTFLFNIKFVICKDRHLHILQSTVYKFLMMTAPAMKYIFGCNTKYKGY